MATVLERALTAPYPGYDKNGGGQSPGRALRAVKPEAEEIAKKHKGTLCLFTDKPQIVESPIRITRCPSEMSKELMEYHRTGSVGGLLSGTTTPRADAQPVPRVKPEAQEIATAHRGSSMATVMSSYELPRSARRAPRVKPEAEETAEVHQGGRMSGLLHDPKKLPESSRPVPRVKPDGEENADVGKGRRMKKIMNKYGETPLSCRTQPRVKPEGEENADLDRGKRMGTMVTSYQLPNSARHQPRVKPEGEDSANLDKGGRMSRLVHEASKLPQSPKPPPRTNTFEAKKNAKLNKGSMGSVLRGQFARTLVPSVGVTRNCTKLW